MNVLTHLLVIPLSTHSTDFSGSPWPRGKVQAPQSSTDGSDWHLCPPASPHSATSTQRIPQPLQKHLPPYNCTTASQHGMALWTVSAARPGHETYSFSGSTGYPKLQRGPGKRSLAVAQEEEKAGIAEQQTVCCGSLKLVYVFDICLFLFIL